MKPLVSQLWPQFMADPDFAACFGQVIVEHARMLRQDVYKRQKLYNRVGVYLRQVSFCTANAPDPCVYFYEK